MAFVVPSEHPDGGEWQVTPANGGGLHLVHTVTLENSHAASQDEANAVIAANEARYTGKEDGGNGEEPDEHEEAPPTQ